MCAPACLLLMILPRANDVAEMGVIKPGADVFLPVQPSHHISVHIESAHGQATDDKGTIDVLRAYPPNQSHSITS